MEDAYSMGSGDIELTVDCNNATICSIKCRGNSQMAGQHGYVAIEDRTTGKFHFKPEHNVPTESTKKDGIVLTQSVTDADMIMTQHFAADKDSIQWSVQVTTEREDVREVHLHFVVPVFGPNSHGFTANAQCPLIPGRGDDHMMVVYGPNMWNEECFHCSVLPMVSSYDPDTDAGLAIIQPPDIAKPRMEYFFVRQQPNISMVVRWTHLRLQRSKAVNAKMLLVPIKGCWRDALKSIHDLYPDYFRIHSESIFSHEGPMTCGELIEENDLDTLVTDHSLSWQEIHADVFERYGDYAPQKDSWPNWIRKSRLEDFDLERLSRTEFRDLNSAITNKDEVVNSRQGLNNYIAMLHQKSVGAYLYTNPVVLDMDYIGNYPDSLAESAEGTPLFHDYYRNAPMCPAAETTWGRYLDEMTERAMDLFPEIDGFFLDELHWNQFDFAHDDGVSARKDKKAAMLGFAVQDAARRICTAAHSRGKAVWANGPTTLEVVHYVDGFMAECSWEWLGSVRFLGLEKPVVLLIPGDWDVSKVRNSLNAALLAGAQPGIVHTANFKPESMDLMRCYRPLFKLLQRRQWVLHPNAVTTDSSVLETNLFSLPESKFAVPFSCPVGSDYEARSADGYMLSKDNNERTVNESSRITLRWPGVDSICSARLFSAEESEHPLDMRFDKKNGTLSFQISQTKAGVVLLKTSV